MFLSGDLLNTLSGHIRESHRTDYAIRSIIPVSGGSINRAYQLRTLNSSYFVKINDNDLAIRMFLAEAEGLKKLYTATRTAKIPQCIGLGQAKGDAFLLMEWIDPRTKSNASSTLLGKAIAQLHQNTGEQFGLTHDNFLGTTVQSNTFHMDWVEFFVAERLEKQLQITKRLGLGDRRLYDQFEQLYHRLPQLCPAEAPALLHGDLWGGNYLIDAGGVPVLIDPAVYYGHREVDIAMTMLFGGFDKIFYDAYNDDFPLEKDWKKRVCLWNLYPLLFHLNAFGASYMGQLKACLTQYL